LKIKKHIILKI